MRQPIRLRPGCKINLGLKIGPRLANGYHELQTIFYPLVFPCDEMEINPKTEPGLSLHCSSVPAEENILTRAYQLFSQTTNLSPGIDVKLTKRIPAGAGLGGGSSNAAHFLFWLNHITARPLAQGQLLELAALLGADVPFFLIDQPCYATGNGSKLTKIRIKAASLWVVLLCPPVFSSTALAYSELDKLRMCQKNLTICLTEGKELVSTDQVLDVRFLDVANDLEQPVFAAFPALAHLKEKFLASGAIKSAMSGSGSAVYGIFNDCGKAQEAAALFRLQGIKTFTQPMHDFGM